MNSYAILAEYDPNSAKLMHASALGDLWIQIIDDTVKFHESSPARACDRDSDMRRN